mmetsp:Transcript_22257/g.55836  ORF Transcript_22257/g.55836 Transcript_22257/m.55836 type:complete len:114 (-) Transcript_22257:57-398(-)|eukprot:CAMPEP_0177638670 /NCGR_PEP_ID=MMETSP0447-20121125/5616_1 /TAXON_ID=0 /ORGANISM="Stygamoeba regulata, Strain BSH-02190019" /LENGTH=113 /DNA_ID=CAMNT_0019140655 /DNA_START=789 /DNA_END=1130 /DNA_ORIENTATION=-
MALHALVGATLIAFTGRYALQAYRRYLAAPKSAAPSLRKFYPGGFQAEMTRDEAAKILGVRQTASPEKISTHHKRIMIANHPDRGGSTYLATKINEAKDVLLQSEKKKRGRSW